MLVNWEEQMVFKVSSMVGQHRSFPCTFDKANPTPERHDYSTTSSMPMPLKNAAEMLSEGTVMKTSATHKTILADMQDHFDNFLCIDECTLPVPRNLQCSKDRPIATLC